MKRSIVFIVLSCCCMNASANAQQPIAVQFEPSAVFSEMIALIHSFEMVEVVPHELLHAATIGVPCDETQGWVNIFTSIDGFASVIVDTVLVTPGGGQSQTLNCQPADEAVYNPASSTLMIPKTHDGAGNVFRVELVPPFNILSAEQL